MLFAGDIFLEENDMTKQFSYLFWVFSLILGKKEANMNLPFLIFIL